MRLRELIRDVILPNFFSSGECVVAQMRCPLMFSSKHGDHAEHERRAHCVAVCQINEMEVALFFSSRYIVFLMRICWVSYFGVYVEDGSIC